MLGSELFPPVVPHRAPALSVIVPAYNEENRLAPAVRRVHAFLARWEQEAEIIIVDDGSQDGTLREAEKLRAELSRLRVVRCRLNEGKGNAVRRGVAVARGESILFTDADLSTPIEELARLKPWLDRGHHIVIASRQHKQSEILSPQPVLRRTMGRVFRGIVSLLAVRGIRDTQCGFKLFRADVAKQIFASLKTRGFAFDVEILMKAQRLGLRIAEVGVRWRDSRESKVRPWKDSWRMLREILRMRGWI